jgi:hypothetical protein
LLLIPALVWNVLFACRLPQAFSPPEFWRDIPLPLRLVENISRIFVFSIPFLMPLEVSTRSQRWALLLFAIGTLIYFASWIALIAVPMSAWSTSALGFLALAYTPTLWLLALGFLGQRLYWGNRYRWWIYLIPTTLFLGAHLAHAALVFARTH